MIKETIYAKYIRERDGSQIIENEYGFIIYKISGEECFIKDMCVDLSSRTSGKGRELMNELEEIARANRCTFISGTIHLFDKNANDTLKKSLSVGFLVKEANNNILVIIKDMEVSDG